MSVLEGQDQAISPLLPPSTYVRYHKILSLKSAKLSELPTSKSFRSSMQENSTTVNIEMLMQSPMKKRKLMSSKRPIPKQKKNTSLMHSSTAATYDKPQKKTRPLSSTVKSLLNKRKSINLQDKLYSKSPSARNYIRPFIPPNGLTAYSYIIMQANHQVHISWNSKTMVQIASLTKIMTCLCILNMIRIYQLDKHQQVEVGIVETTIIGTSAGLKKGYKYTIEQLLYGLMLPSGNDASLALAVWGGKILTLKNWKPATIIHKKREAIALFVQYMNHTAKQLDLKKTKFSNPHGLPSPDNKSTAYDIALLCQIVMKNIHFQKIVSTKEHTTVVRNQIGQNQQVIWKNTHKLLRKQCYLGVKTGITATAGACLSSHIKINQRFFTIVVLNCKKLQRRFKQTQILRKWLYKKQGLCKVDKSLDFQIQADQGIEGISQFYNQ